MSRFHEHDGLSELPERSLQAIRSSVVEGSLASVMANTAGGTYLTGFALALGASEATIGLLASLPNVSNLVQLFGGYWLRRTARRRLPCTMALLASRLVWLPVLAIPLLRPTWAVTSLLLLLLVAYGLASALAAFSGVTWLAWLADLVPETVRGRFFSRRNMLATSFGVTASLAAGWFVDHWMASNPSTTATLAGFTWVFAAGIAAGLTGVWFMSRMPEVTHTREAAVPFLGAISEPLSNPQFRLLILAMALWGFAVSLASPFFTVHMIENLGVPFSLIAVFGLVSSVFSVLGTRLWGPIVDTYGASVVLRVTTLVAASIPFVWLFATPQAYQVIYLVNAISGLAWAGIGIASAALLLKLSPQVNRSVYLGMYAAATGLAAAVAPVIGGLLGTVVRSWELSVGGFELAGLHFVFISSFVLRLSGSLVLSRIRVRREHSLRVMMRIARRSPAYKRARRLALTPVYASRFAWHTGLGAVDNMANAVSRGFATLERHVEQLGEGTRHLLGRGNGVRKGLWHRLELALMAVERALLAAGTWFAGFMGLIRKHTE